MMMDDYGRPEFTVEPALAICSNFACIKLISSSILDLDSLHDAV